tara:strand:- start:785 stop:1255 length:471 start_codon:yes stop_codon:yes gene_type:complete
VLINKQIEKQLNCERNIIRILDDAAYAEKFLSKPNNKRRPSMFQLIETTCGYTKYDKEDYGYHVDNKLKLRATPRQMTHYDLAIDFLMEVKDDISDDPVTDRKLLWLRANRIKWSTLSKMFGKHRTTVKRMYEIILNRLATKINSTTLDKYDKFFI